jgi:hypothetical protein
VLDGDQRREVPAANVADHALRGRVQPPYDTAHVDQVARDVDVLERLFDLK